MNMMITPSQGVYANLDIMQVFPEDFETLIAVVDSDILYTG
jgi:hypothetical protein